MNRIILGTFLFLLGFSSLFAQTVYSNYCDGKIYVNVRRNFLKSVSDENPQNIPLSKLSFLKELISKYDVKKANKPFYQAVDDDFLPYVLKLEFTKIHLVEDFIEDLNKLDGIEFAEKVSLNKTDVVPNDVLFASASGSTHLNQINAQNAWNVFSGNSNITVAIVDNAVMWTHTDLAANTYTNAVEAGGSTGVDDDGNGYIDDINGYDVANMDGVTTSTDLAQDHGTHCAGIAGAVSNNTIGIASIGWGIKIIPVKTSFDNSGPSAVDFGYEGIIYAVRAKAKIISCSWGGSGSSTTEQAVINYAWNRGCIVICSAGNNNTAAPGYPGAYTNAYCVAAVNPSNVKSSYSNYGSWVDICAPGDNILSTVPYTSTPAYLSKNGTSMATPLVAGLAALMLSKSPNMTRSDVLNCISTTAANIYSLSGNSAYVSGNQLGAGRIDAFAAMNCAATYSALPPVANFYAFLPSTCPNTPISFIDSSLYSPTTWNWVFQGGTPATSTLSNPSVQWSTPGVYSVSLTVSNGNGSNAKQKLSYITVSAASSLPFAEGFQSTTFLPNNWQANNIWNDAMYWERTTGVGGFGTSTACAMFNNYFYNAAGEKDEMRTPKFDFTNVASARLRFDVAYARYNSSYSDTLQVKASANCGSTWTNIYTVGGSSLATRSDFTGFFVPTSAQWRRDSIDVSSVTAGQSFAQFSFINRGHYGQPIYLDNINLVFPNPTLSVVHSATACAGTSISFTNTSQSAASYTWNFQGGTPAISTSSSPSVTYPSSGIYTVIMIGVNGTSTASISRTLAIVANPTISSATSSLCSGNSSTLSVTGASSYTWYAGSGAIGNGSSIVVSPSATTIYTVIGLSGSCVSSAQQSVNVISNPTVSAGNQSICAGSSATITATGANTYTWNTNSNSPTIIVSPSVTTTYTVTGESGGCINTKTVSVNVTPQFTLTAGASPSAKCAGESSTLTAIGALSYTWSSGGTGSTTVVSPGTTSTYTVIGLNGICTNSTAVSVSVVPAPNLSVMSTAASSICAGTQVTLTASGATTYSWSNGSNTPSISVSPSISTTYSVIGTDPGCSITQTIAVTIGTSTLAVSISASSTSLCAGSSATLAASGANSYTWSNGSNGTSIVVSPSVSSNYTLEGSSGTCTGTTTSNIIVIALPVSVLSTSNALCSTSCNGILTASTSGGTGPYTYSLSNSSCTLLPCNSLCPGLYTLYSFNSEGCKSSNLFSISSPAALQASLTVSNASCATCASGIISSNTYGGTPPYSYTWSPSGGNAAIASDLLPGCYTVTIVDKNGCSRSNEACVDVNPDTGLNQLTSEESLRIYPNPTHDLLYVRFDSDNFNVSVYSNLGQLILLKENNHESVEIDLSSVSKGVYFVEVKNKDGKIIKKLLVN